MKIEIGDKTYHTMPPSVVLAVCVILPVSYGAQMLLNGTVLGLLFIGVAALCFGVLAVQFFLQNRVKEANMRYKQQMDEKINAKRREMLEWEMTIRKQALQREFGIVFEEETIVQ